MDFQGDSGGVLFAADYLLGEETEEVGTEKTSARRERLALRDGGVGAFYRKVGRLPRKRNKGKEEIDLTIGANLKRLRLSKNMSQADLAKAVSVTQPMIAQIERGTKSLTMELGREISEVLEVPIDALLEDSTKQTA